MFQARKVYNCSHELLRYVTMQGPTDKMARQMRAIDNDLCSMMLAAEKRSNKKYRSPWSKELGLRFRTNRFWRLYTRNFHQLEEYQDVLLDLSQYNGWKEIPHVSIAEAVKAARKAQQDLRDLRRNNDALRDNMLGVELKEATDTGDIKKAQTL